MEERMRNAALATISAIALFGCSDAPQKNELRVVVKEGRFDLHTSWTYEGDSPVKSFYSEMFACWLDDKAMVVRSGSKQDDFPQGRDRVETGAIVGLGFQDSDYNRGRLCFVEVVLFTHMDGAVVQRTHVSNVVESPSRKPAPGPDTVE
jgi:hypothetical protein